VDTVKDGAPAMTRDWDNPRPDDGPTKAEERADNARRTRFALDVWGRGRSVIGSPGETYLAMRGLPLPRELDGEVVRWVADCPRERGTHPALVVLYRSMEGDQPRAIQRLFITPRFEKLQAMMLGPTRGAAMKLTSHRATCCGAVPWYAPQLHVCEGFETGLGLLALGYRPVWALGMAGAIERLPVLWFVGQIVVAVDNDGEQPPDTHGTPGTGSAAGHRAAAELKRVWGWRARMIMPSKPGTDFADLAKATLDAEAPL
jgi:putative DNA primase/helicase